MLCSFSYVSARAAECVRAYVHAYMVDFHNLLDAVYKNTHISLLKKILII